VRCGRWVAALVAGCLGVLPVAPAAAAAVPCGPRVTDPLAGPPWGLTRLRPDLAWPLSTGSGVTVAVVDSGVSPDHPTLAGKVRPGKDFVESGGDGGCDENGHGTLIAGIIAGREATSAGFRFHGVAPDATIVPVRVLRDQRRSTEGDLSDRIATAIRWAVDVGGADVVNLSLTTPPSPRLEEAVGYALGRRVVLTAAAGNQGDSDVDQRGYPAAYPGVIAVAGVNEKDEHVGSSVEGDYVDVAAPGVDVAGPATSGGGYLFTADGGTSFATAYVSGVAALIRAYDPELSPAQVARRITETADHAADLWNPQVGHGVVNPARAVGSLRPAAPAAAKGSGGGRVAAPVPPDDPQRWVRAAAGWVALAGVCVALLVLVAVPVVRLGRRRGWRSGALP